MTERPSIQYAAEQSENQSPRASTVLSVKPHIIRRQILSAKSLNYQESTSPPSHEQKKKRHWFRKLRMPFFCRAVEEDKQFNLPRTAQSNTEFSCIKQRRTDVDETFERFGFTKTPQLEELEGITLPFFAPLHELDNESLELLQRKVFGMPPLSDSDSGSMILIQNVEQCESINITGNVPVGGSLVKGEEAAEGVYLSSLILSNCSTWPSSSIQSSKDLILDAKNGEDEHNEYRQKPPSSFYSPMVEGTAICCTYERGVDDVSSPVHLYSGISDLLLSPSRLLSDQEECEEHLGEEMPQVLLKRLNSCLTHRQKTLELSCPQRFEDLDIKF